MNIPFRQGIVRCLDSGFLTTGPTHVSLNVLDVPTTVTLTHGSVEYLFVESQSVANAWGPITPGVDQWLYWDIHTLTAARTFGITLHRPIVQSMSPANPLNDQHWFDTSSNVMKVWNSRVNRWTEVIRVFACELNQGVVPLSVSESSPLFTGTQVGLSQPYASGTILFDAGSNKPLRTADNKFLTGETRLQATTGATSSIRTEAMIVEAEAQSNMSAYTVVKFVAFGKVDVADYFTPSVTQQYGIVEASATIGDVVVVTMSGIVTNPLWNWTSVNMLLYVDGQGQLTTSQFGTSRPVGIVIDTNKILLYPSIANSGETAIGGSAFATVDAAGVVRLSVPAANVGLPIAVGDNDPRVASALQTTGGMMTGSLILHNDPVAPLEATTKQYVDNQISMAGTNPAAEATGRVSLVNANAGPLAIGTPVYISGNGAIDKAEANAASTSVVIGLVSDLSIAPTLAGYVAVSGVLTATTPQWDTITGQTGGLTPGASYFLSPYVPGMLTTILANVVGQYVAPIGVALSTTKMKVMVDPTIQL